MRQDVSGGVGVATAAGGQRRRRGPSCPRHEAAAGDTKKLRKKKKKSNLNVQLEGLILKLKLQYGGHLIQRANPLEKILILGKIKGKKRSGQHRI